MSAPQNASVAIVGSTGLVGTTVLECLKETKFPVDTNQLKLFGSSRSAGKNISTPWGDRVVEEFSAENCGADFIFLCVSGEFAKKYGQELSKKGIVIDNSSAWRQDPSVPLLVPEINQNAATGKTLIANPNCTTAILLMALAPLSKAFGLERVLVSTYQAASGAGLAAMQELETQTTAFLAGKPLPTQEFAFPLAFNLIPQIDSFQENRYTREEMKVTWETRKILELPELPISCTAVRIPTFRAHAESVTVQTKKPVDLKALKEIWERSPGLEVCDNPAEKIYPMPLTATKKSAIEVGRLRHSLIWGKYGVEFFVCGDQLLRGAALNAVLIAHGKYQEQK